MNYDINIQYNFFHNYIYKLGTKCNQIAIL